MKKNRRTTNKLLSWTKETTGGVVGLGMGSMVAGSLPGSPALSAAMPAFGVVGGMMAPIAAAKGGNLALEALGGMGRKSRRRRR